jgi:hypothetical protein
VIPAFVRQHVTAKGNPKVAYETETQAKAEAACSYARFAYQCGLCGLWHLSSKDIPPTQRRPKVPWYGESS